MSWRKFLPFRSTLVKKAFEHMTREEKRQAGRRGALYGLWIGATVIYPVSTAVQHPSSYVLVLTGTLIVVGIAGAIWR